MDSKRTPPYPAYGPGNHSSYYPNYYPSSSVPPQQAVAPPSEEQPFTGVGPYLHILRKRKWILILSLGLTLSIAIFINLTAKPVYRTATEVVIEAKRSEEVSGITKGSSIMRDPTFIITQTRMIQGQELARRVLTTLDQLGAREDLRIAFGLRTSLGESKNERFTPEERRRLMGSIRGSIAARQMGRGVRILKIIVTGYSPVIAAKIADTAAEVYIQMGHEARMQSFKKNFSIISRSLEEVRAKIKTGEIAVQKIDSEVKLLEALKIYGAKHPAVIELVKNIPILTQNLQEGMDNLRKMEIGQRKDLLPLLLQSHTNLRSLSALENDLYNLKPILDQEIKTNREMYNTLFRRLQEIELSGGSSLWLDAEVIEPASIPGSPIRPNKKMNIMIAFLVGLLLGLGLCFFLEYMDSSLRSLDDIQNYLKVFPLGMVPQVELEDKTEVDEKGIAQASDLTRAFWSTNDEAIPLHVSEAYRIIRTNLAFGLLDQSLKVFQVTSAVKGEGKTTTTANLGISLAQAGMKVLLVDADMRRPSLHRILRLEGVKHGLNDLISDSGTNLESVIEPTSVPNLSCLPAGAIPPNPAELLSSKRMKALTAELKAHFDVVLIDSPPVISVADSPIIASRVDGTILVARSGYLPRHLCLQAKKAIETVNGKVIGCVLNSVLSAHHPYYYYRYYNYGKYYYYGDENEKKKTKKTKGRSGGPLSSWERLKLLKDPAFSFFLDSWQRVTRSKKGSPVKEMKASEDSEKREGVQVSDGRS